MVPTPWINGAASWVILAALSAHSLLEPLRYAFLGVSRERETKSKLSWLSRQRRFAIPLREIIDNAERFRELDLRPSSVMIRKEHSC
jgi:hypothetical protein